MLYFNEIICNFLDMGYKGTFETRVCCLNKEAHPEKQVPINIYIKEIKQINLE